MRLETKFVQVPNDPQTINAINNLAANWGWSVQSIQVTDSKVSYEGDSFGWVSDYGAYVQKEIITEHTNYASITYQRDMDNEKYPRLCACEQEYNACDHKVFLSDEEMTIMDNAKKRMAAHDKKTKWVLILWIVFALIGSFGNDVILLISLVLGGYGTFCWIAKRFGKKYPEWEHNYLKLQKKNEGLRNQEKQEIIQKARIA